METAQKKTKIVEPGSSLWSESWRRLRRNRAAMLSLIYLAVLMVVCFSSQLFLSLPWYEEDILKLMEPPSAQNWFGTDSLGRDLFSLVLYGGRISLTVGLVTTIVSTFIGVIYGTVSGYFGGAVDRWMMWVVDLLYSLPGYFVIILIMVTFTDISIYALFLILALLQWLSTARIVRGQILTLKERDYVLALRSCGVSEGRIMFAHLVPNCAGIVAVYATLGVPAVMLQEAFLSFIGFQFKIPVADGRWLPAPSWGSLISEGVGTYLTHPWQLVFPAIFFSITLLAINFFGDGIRDALDPNMRA